MRRDEKKMEDLGHGFICSKSPFLNIFLLKQVFYFEPRLEWHTVTRNAVGSLHIFYVVCHSGTFF